ncbi:MAG: hypothetical protein ACYC8T_35175 [Myxococcaceae bacterium]
MVKLSAYSPPPVSARPKAALPTTARPVPQGLDGFTPAKGPSPVVLNPPAGGAPTLGDAIVQAAREKEGQTLTDLLDHAGDPSDPFLDGLSGRVPAVEGGREALDEFNSCANFVSAALRAAGVELPNGNPFTRITGVTLLRERIEGLEGQGFHTVYSINEPEVNAPPASPPASVQEVAAWFEKNCKPGDVVIFRANFPTENNEDGHAVIYTGLSPPPSSEPMFIGANSINENGEPPNPDGSQSVTEVPLSVMQGWIGSNCEVTGVYHPEGA